MSGCGGMADAQDSKSCGGDLVWVQVPPSASNENQGIPETLVFPGFFYPCVRKKGDKRSKLTEIKRSKLTEIKGRKAAVLFRGYIVYKYTIKGKIFLPFLEGNVMVNLYQYLYPLNN